jgi:hypothetical protein
MLYKNIIYMSEFNQQPLQNVNNYPQNILQGGAADQSVVSSVKSKLFDYRFIAVIVVLALAGLIYYFYVKKEGFSMMSGGKKYSKKGKKSKQPVIEVKEESEESEESEASVSSSE